MMGFCQNPFTPRTYVISGSVEGTDAGRVMPIWTVCLEPIKLFATEL
jgi:hypothetical protein